MAVMLLVSGCGTRIQIFKKRYSAGFTVHFNSGKKTAFEKVATQRLEKQEAQVEVFTSVVKADAMPASFLVNSLPLKKASVNVQNFSAGQAFVEPVIQHNKVFAERSSKHSLKTRKMIAKRSGGIFDSVHNFFKILGIGMLIVAILALLALYLSTTAAIVILYLGLLIVCIVALASLFT